jgi:type II secretory pathway pseudopilin PulG
MVIRHSSLVGNVGERSIRGLRFLHVASRFTPHALRTSQGFTILEIILVLFLLAGLLGLVIPRIVLDDTLASIGRKWIATLRAIQELSMTTQKTVKLSIDIDQGRYWPVILDGNQEKPPTDARWTTPIILSETIRFSDIQVGSTKRSSGRVDLFFYPNGKMDSASIYFTDDGINLLGVHVEPITSTIRTSDQRLEAPRPWTIPDRVRTLLQVQTVNVPPLVPR